MRTVAVSFLFAYLVGVQCVPSWIVPYIIGGSPTTIDHYPYMVALYYADEPNDYKYQCGGTILTQRTIMTAAHCLTGTEIKKWRARAGSTFINKDGHLYYFEKDIIHPNYEDLTKDSDIALMRTSSDIVYSDVLKAATLAGPSYVLPDETLVWAAGWGKTETGYPKDLRHVEIKVVNQATCANLYLAIHFTITENMLCVGDIKVGGKDQCYGDSGSPLSHNGTVVGVCSGGYGCGNPKYPGINTRVSKFYDWIQKNL